jgi:hypothetical protein
MKGLIRGVLALAVALSFGVPAFAQGGGASSTGTIQGRVADAQGAVMPGVTVTATSPALIQPQTTVTSETGNYRFPAVPPGVYSLSFELAGFNTLKRDGITITLGFTAQVNVELALATLQEAEWAPLAQVVETNITGLVALTRALLPGLIARKGAIINLSSVAATYPYRGGAVYGGSKAFVRQLSLDLRADLQGLGVRVTSIEPGMVETEFTLVRNGWDQAASDKLYGNMDPLTAEDIAETIHWVATLPPHVNINTLELMPVNQSFAGFQVTRND